MTTLAKLSALWVSTHQWQLAATARRTDRSCFIETSAWQTPPTWTSPAGLVAWAASVAQSGERHPPRMGKTYKFRQPRDLDQITRFALLVAPRACDAFGVPTMPADGQPHPWAEQLAAAGWKVRTRTRGAWLTVERPGMEIGILMVGWLPPRELADNGVIIDRGAPQGWATMYVYGEYHRLTGWPLAAGPGMAAIKGLWRYPRTERVHWAPDAEYWARVPPVAEGRAHRPWHVNWTAWPDAFPPPVPDGRVTAWDANAAYLNGWGTAVLARDKLTHTGPDPIANGAGRWDPGYYLIGPVQWPPGMWETARRLPPVHGSRTPDSKGSVWVTHVILDLLDSLTHDPEHQAPTYRILDSWTSARGGQLARGWADKLKHALTEARREREKSDELETRTLERVLKISYARGYPLLEKAGFMRRPDHVDTLIDQTGSSAYRLMWVAARTHGRYPLDVSADQITYLRRPQDDDGAGPLGPDDPYRFGGYKSKHTGTLQEWHQAHADGRNGQWWLPAPAPRPEPGTRDSAPATGPARPEADDFLDELFD